MLEIRITAPELSESVNRLADAISSGKAQTTPPQAPINPAPINPAPAPVAPAPAPVAPAPAMPAMPTAAPAFTIDMVARAGASLVDAGKMPQLREMLHRYGVEAITQLKADQLTAVAGELRAMGAAI